jgi:hypothetical protein
VSGCVSPSALSWISSKCSSRASASSYILSLGKKCID